jgi:uncharacterized protein
MTNERALVTGASGGIGEALARELAARGLDLVIVARSEDKLAALASELESTHSINVRAIATDLTRAGAVTDLVATLGDLEIDVLVNNAGYANYGKFWENDAAKERDMVQLNVVVLEELTRALLPAMVSRGRGRVMNLASTAAFMPGPLMSNYYATKAYVLSLSEGLANELHGTGVTVTALCPGPTESGFQNRADMGDSKLVRGKRLPSAAQVAKAGCTALFAGKVVYIPGFSNRLQVLTPKFLPRRIVPGFVRKAQEKTAK